MNNSKYFTYFAVICFKTNSENHVRYVNYETRVRVLGCQQEISLPLFYILPVELFSSFL